MLTLSYQDFSTLSQSVAYGGLRRLSPATELLLLSLYDYELLPSWANDDGSDLTDAQVDQIDQWTADAQYEISEPVAVIPIGAVLPYYGTTVPANALLCNGATYNRVDYPDLYDALPVQMRVGTSRFVVPNLIDRAIRNTNTTSSVNTTAGDDTISLSPSNIPPHTHTYLRPVSAVTATLNAGAPVFAWGNPQPVQSTGSTGGGQSFSVLNRINRARHIIIASV